jgi:multidrug efflux pump subunit AcrA (membrane-fusion protein)
MRFLRSRRFLVTAGVVVVAVAAWLLLGRKAPADASVVTRPTRGEFVVPITVSGELRALSSVQITAPANAQQAGVYQMRIQSLVAEGTVVKAGDVVAEIDRSALASRMTEVGLALQKAEALAEQARLDSALTLSTAREAIRNLVLQLEEKRLAKEQAVFEAPTVRRQADIDYERTQRAEVQARADYVTRTEQAQAKQREVGADVARQRNTLQIVQQVLEGFTVRAPAPGMVIYVKEWNGRKRTTGSQVSSWDAAVATLPDLSKMESVCYVNEIDVRHLAVGQPVAITLDSDPAKRLTGKVASVANVGEQRPNADSKVFEVKVTVTESDTTLRPGMTTGNAIETLRIPDALSVPLEAINSEDGVTFAYRQSGGSVVRQEVVTGAMNDVQVVVLLGLGPTDRVLLSAPLEPLKLELVRLPGGAAAAARGDTAKAGVTGRARDSTARGRAGDSTAGRPARRNAPPAPRR